MKQPYPHWYAVQTLPRAEATADQNLRRIGYHTFFPFQRVRRRRKRPNSTAYLVEWIEQPYFPRYIFVAFRGLANESIGSVTDTVGVSAVVSCDDGPLEIPHAVMDELMARADENGMIGTYDAVARRKYSSGQKVFFHNNAPLAGFVVEVAIDAGREVRVWLDMLGSRRQVSVSPQMIAGTV